MKEEKKEKQKRIDMTRHVWVYATMISIGIMAMLYFLKIDITMSASFDNMLDATITFDSIVIGFIGVLISLLISAKEQSAMLIYFFEEIDNDFFSKYMSRIIVSGLTVILLTLLLYVRDAFYFEEYIIGPWAWLLVYFVLKTYFLIDKILQLLIKKKHTLNTNTNTNTKEYLDETQDTLDMFK